MNDGEFLKYFINPAGDFPGELFVAFVSRLDIDESSPPFVCSPFHSIQDRASPFYVHVAGAFVWGMPFLSDRVSPKPSRESGEPSHSPRPLRRNGNEGG